MKTNRSKQHTIETLSAYLDGQLSERETEILRQQLENDAALRNQLEDLRQTRYVLRQTPKLKRRRSFVLSPEMVKQQKTFFRAMNVSRMVSAAASVLLVVALGSQYLIGGSMGMASAPMADSVNYEMAEDMTAEEPMMAMEAPAEEAAEAPAMDAAGDEPAEAQAAEPEEEADVAGFAKTEETPTVMADEPADDAENAADEVQGTDLPAGGGGEPPEDQGDASPAEPLPTAALEGTQRSVVPDKDVGESEDGALPHDLPEDERLIPAEEWDTQSTNQRISPLRVVQGVLLLLAIAGGLSAAFFRKKVR